MQQSTFTTKSKNCREFFIFHQTGKRCDPPEVGFFAEQRDYQNGCPLVWTRPHLHHHLVHFHLTAQIVCGDGENWCRTDRAVHCRRSRVSLPLVLVVGKRDHHSLELMDVSWRVDECICFRLPKTQLVTHCLLISGAMHEELGRWGLTMLNDAMLLQCPAQLQSLTPALRFSVLKEPVDQLAAGKRALICNTMLLS